MSAAANQSASDAAESSMKILTLCTGNVARSVMLGYMLSTLGEVSGADWRVRTAGTLAVQGAGVSVRTRDALLAIDDLGQHRYDAHRSHQVTTFDLRWAHVVLASEADHVRYVRAVYPDLASTTVSLGQFVRFAPLDVDLASQLAEVTGRELDDGFDVVDPAGGDQADYDACARHLWGLAQAFSILVQSVQDVL